MPARRSTNYSLKNAKGKLKYVDGKWLIIWGGEGERESGQGNPPADPPEGGDKSKEDPPDGDEGGEGDEDDDDDDDDDKDDVAKGKKKDNTPSLEDQFDEEKRLRLKAERDLAKKNKAVKDAEADKDVVKDRDRLKTKLEARDKFLTDNLIIMEINKQKKYDFIDVDDVVRAFKPDEVTIDLDDDEPVVEGLDLALKRVAKAKPHFLKKAKDEEDDDDRQPSGSHPRGNKTESQVAEDKRLGEKFKIPGYGTQALRPM